MSKFEGIGSVLLGSQVENKSFLIELKNVLLIPKLVTNLSSKKRYSHNVCRHLRGEKRQ